MSPAARGARALRRATPGRPSARQRGSRSGPRARSRTALQRHVDFFDTNGDGRITLSDTYDGLRRLGFGALRAGAFAGVALRRAREERAR